LLGEKNSKKERKKRDILKNISRILNTLFTRFKLKIEFLLVN
jgi:hypothetical protein